MIPITAKNFAGESIELSSAGGKFAIMKVDGLGPQTATISTQKMARHGTEFVHSTTDERNIVIYLAIGGDAAANRADLYKFLPPGLPVELTITTANGIGRIVGYPENNEVDPFAMVSTAQLSILCPDPFFKASPAAYNVSATPVVIKSSCPYDTGMVVTATFTEAAESFAVTNQTTGETLHLYKAFAVGDVLTIDTAQRTIKVNGVNAYNSKPIKDPWAMLRMGDNSIVCSHAATITFVDRFMGL